jgi:hypothetical protein
MSLDLSDSPAHNAGIAIRTLWPEDACSLAKAALREGQVPSVNIAGSSGQEAVFANL